ncbi:MAG: hypothetical protein WA101_00330 [Minisyncoccia bacterium]
MADIKVTDESTIKIPNRSTIFGVERKDWVRIKSLVEDVSLRPSIWENAAWFFLATTISIFIAYFSFEKINQLKSLFLVAGISSVLITIILFIVNKNFLNVEKRDKRRIVSEMDKMEIKDETTC